MNKPKLTDHVLNVCKVGQGADKCRYLFFGISGFECCKLSGMKQYMDMNVTKGLIAHKGDNCDGLTISESINKLNHS